MTLKHVRRIRIEACDVIKTVDAIRTAGKNGYELFVVWSGTCNNKVFNVAKVHIPEQTSYKFDTGLCVRVDGSELHRLNMWLYEARQVIGVQVHGHPTDAYHSETDDTYPIATLEGSISIVLPFFGHDGWGSNDIVAYRLEKVGWVEITEPLNKLIKVIGNGVS